MAAMVGGAFLSGLFNVLLERLASREVLDFFTATKLDHRLLKKLQITMISVNGLLDDAEEKQISRPAVVRWLDELKDAAYQADDLLDEIAYESIRLEAEAGGGGGGGQVRKFLSALNPRNYKGKREINERLEEIYEILEHLVQQKGVLGLIEKNIISHVLPSSTTSRLPTTSLVDESVVYGRNDEKEVLVQMVLSNGGDDDGCLGVIPIVGMGGIGKTTLAQLVYNDERVKRWFNVKVWACVSETFDARKLVEDVLRGVSEVSYGGNVSEEFLHSKLEEVLRDKKVLLVLDDVWSDDVNRWEFLLRPFKSVAEGSKIVVTTRDERVALVKSTTPSFQLKKLKDDDCWLLFGKYAFGAETSLHLHPNLEGIGRDVIRKCDGLPLAVKTLGSLLRSKRDVKDWEKVLKSPIWEVADDKILPALKLSYYYLPSHLKQCFAFCGIFPKDCKISKEELIRLWMAEGLIQNREDKEMEEIGEECIQELVSRSFLQQSRDHPAYLAMHDLVNDLATLVCGEFCLRLEGGNISRVATVRTRYLSLDGVGNSNSSRLEEQTRRAKFLREISSMSAHGVDVGKDLHDLLMPLDHLRVLNLPQCYNLSKFPDSIGKLKHLRYLDLSGTRIESLPKLVCALFYLQTLILCRCTRLVKLPNQLGNLKYLRHLDLRRTSIRRLPTTMGRLTSLHYLDVKGTYLYLYQMPPHMGRLTKLQILRDFFVGKLSSGSITELGSLENLKELCIQNLENVLNVSQAAKANLIGKKYIEKLSLRWGDDSDDSFSERERDILAQLQPSTNLKALGIYNYRSVRFPDWVGHPCFSNLATLTLSGCRYCSHLPPLGQLMSLKELIIEDFSNVVIVGPEFYGNCNSNKKPFGSLEKLIFSRMHQLEELLAPEDENEVRAFPLLRQLYMNDCPNLRKLLPNYRLPVLRVLASNDLQKLVAPLPRAPDIVLMTLGLYVDGKWILEDSSNVKLTKLSSGSYRLEASKFNCSLDSLLREVEQVGCLCSNMQRIDIAGWHELNCFPLELFQNLWTLYMWHCPVLESFSEKDRPVKSLSSLRTLSILKCPSLISFPKGGLPAPNLKKLEVGDCSNLKLLPERMQSLLPSLMDLEITECPEIESLPEGGLPSSLKTLVIMGCNKLIAGRMHWNLQTLPSLSSFCIGNSYDVESFPEKTLLPSSLTSLTIYGLPNLKSLHYKGFQDLSFLKELKITICEKLQALPEEGLPSSLEILDILGCPLLEKRCQQENEEDWSKIAHIPKLLIRHATE
ncbi:hypothetical protein Tsubulata_037990 [Turnera subulata]|uniref:Disease resistance RPP13-like protein 1 n=1 Tax=Turnera subulata TaxID=218843 RepID=A0A9Q0GIB3_9ROSI|nr:hypothetical protein Tsubulata_037990 [Turnera subulata]KAJ4848841.1 hypothetical protein Tsubulata_037990 [Turnera subulata]